MFDRAPAADILVRVSPSLIFWSSSSSVGSISSHPSGGGLRLRFTFGILQTQYSSGIQWMMTNNWLCASIIITGILGPVNFMSTCSPYAPCIAYTSIAYITVINLTSGNDGNHKWLPRSFLLVLATLGGGAYFRYSPKVCAVPPTFCKASHITNNETLVMNYQCKY